MRIILHSDMNSFYASCEALYHPEFLNCPLAVGGDEKNRHGIILAKNQLAKGYGVKTGEALWEARKKCPDLVIVPPNFERYHRFSKKAKKIYYDYTNQVESYGLDECWLDCTGSKIHGSGEEIAHKIRNRIKTELGLTVSIGVSYNKIFAKFGSDYKKPDAVTVITPQNYKTLVWDQPVEDLLYVGRATKKKLCGVGINTIGKLAQVSPEILERKLGKMGRVLWGFANGLDDSPVKAMSESKFDNQRLVKSISNGITTPRDLENIDDVKMVLGILGESVAMRLREAQCTGQVIGIQVRGKSLRSFTRQVKLDRPTNITKEIIQSAVALFKRNYDFSEPIRSLGVQVSDLTFGDFPIQISLFEDIEERQKQESLDKTLDGLKKRFGNTIVQRGSAMPLKGDWLRGKDPKKDHIIHPLGYF